MGEVGVGARARAFPGLQLPAVTSRHARQRSIDVVPWTAAAMCARGRARAHRPRHATPGRKMHRRCVAISWRLAALVCMAVATLSGPFLKCAPWALLFYSVCMPLDLWQLVHEPLPALSCHRGRAHVLAQCHSAMMRTHV